MEAMACGTPVAAYAAGGLTDVIIDGETGLIEPQCGNIQGLGDMLKWMYQHPLERMQMGVKSRQRVIECFTDTGMAMSYQKLYKNILNSF